MCQEKWYRYACGHLIAARQDQDGFEHCDDWAEGQEETNCPNYDANDLHATGEIDGKCQECKYMTPPTSSDNDED